MPLEGHWQRVNTPLRRLTRRERLVALGALIATAAVLVALVLATSGNSAPNPGPGCIYAVVPGATGAQPIEACGARARRTCGRAARLSDPGALAIQKDCRRAGLLRP